VVAGADPGLNIRSLVDTGVSPGRSFQLLFIGLALAIWALTQHFSANHSRHPSGLTLAHQPALFTTTGIALRDNDVSNYAQTLPVVCAPSRTFLITPCVSLGACRALASDRLDGNGSLLLRAMRGPVCEIVMLSKSGWRQGRAGCVRLMG
jgi:hypothetical protein